jgi:hypothetical protein
MKTQTKPTPAATPATQPPERVPVPEPNADLFRGVEWWKLQPAEEETLRERLLARVVKSLTTIDLYNLRLIAQFMDICYNNRGSDTPAEEFVRKLIMIHYSRGLTPEETAEEVEEFRDSFNFMTQSARVFNARYHEAVKAAA